jgi:hypothetical protein
VWRYAWPPRCLGRESPRLLTSVVVVAAPQVKILLRKHAQIAQVSFASADEAQAFVEGCADDLIIDGARASVGYVPDVHEWSSSVLDDPRWGRSSLDDDGRNAGYGGERGDRGGSGARELGRHPADLDAPRSGGRQRSRSRSPNRDEGGGRRHPASSRDRTGGDDRERHWPSERTSHQLPDDREPRYGHRGADDRERPGERDRAWRERAADWICDRCAGTNFARRTECFQCALVYSTPSLRSPTVGDGRHFHPAATAHACVSRLGQQVWCT